jgi:UDP-glucose 4-epimerase
MQKKSLVTGGAGFIGSHVVLHLLDLHHEVVVLDDLSGGFEENIPNGAIFCQGSILDVALVNSLFEKHSFDYVYHLAAYAAEGLSHFIRRFNYENNLIGSMNLINASVNFGIKCFVFTSSIAVYGTNELPYAENQHPHPEDPYGIAKYAVEMDLKCTHSLFGLNYIIFRPHNVYGSHQHIADKYRNVIGIFMHQVLNNQPLQIFGDGEQARAFTHISDVAPAIACSVENPKAYNEVFNIGVDEATTVNQLAEWVLKTMGVEGEVEHVEARQEVTHAVASHEKFRQVFDTKPGISLEDGLLEMATWVNSVASRKRTNFKGIEIEKNLPNTWKTAL